MKSEKAKEFIDGYINNLTAELADHAKWQIRTAMTHTVELAEQEAEERMREKAKRAFECVWNATPKQVAEECGISIQEINNEAAAMKYCHQLFIQKLTQNGND